MDNQIKHRLIHKILSIKNRKAFSTIDQLLDSLENQPENIELTREQTLMLDMSETDLKNGETIRQDELDNEDLSWLRVQ